MAQPSRSDVAETMIAAAQNDLLSENSHVIRAVAIMLAALLAAKLVDTIIVRSAGRVTGRVARDDLSQATVTRLRLVRRLLATTVVLVGVGLALAQFDTLQKVGNALLASSAMVGLAVGLAARGPLSNGIAGLMLATVQPFRIGDVIEWNGNRGRVEDITLTYTFIRLPSGHRLIVPNESIADSPLENFTDTGADVQAETSVFVTPPHAAAALELLRGGLDGLDVRFGECGHERIELVIGFQTAVDEEVSRRTAAREHAVKLLGDAGMLEATAV